MKNNQPWFYFLIATAFNLISILFFFVFFFFLLRFFFPNFAYHMSLLHWGLSILLSFVSSFVVYQLMFAQLKKRRKWQKKLRIHLE